MQWSRSHFGATLPAQMGSTQVMVQGSAVRELFVNLAFGWFQWVLLPNLQKQMAGNTEASLRWAEFVKPCSHAHRLTQVTVAFSFP